MMNRLDTFYYHALKTAFDRRKGVLFLTAHSGNWELLPSIINLAALKYEAPVLPVFLYQAGEKFHVEIGKEIPLIKTGDKEKDIVANTQKYNQAIEAFVRNHPDQWF